MFDLELEHSPNYGGELKIIAGLRILLMAHRNEHARVRIMTPFLVLLMPVVALQASACCATS